MKQNDFELTGLVSHIDVKYTENGTCIVKGCISKKNPRAKGEDDAWFGLWFDIYGKSAEEFAEKIKKGDTANVKGKVEQERFTTKQGEKINRMVLKAWDFVKVAYDENAKDYFPITDDGKVVQNSNSAKQVTTEEETPWG